MHSHCYVVDLNIVFYHRAIWNYILKMNNGNREEITINQVAAELIEIMRIKIMKLSQR